MNLEKGRTLVFKSTEPNSINASTEEESQLVINMNDYLAFP